MLEPIIISEQVQLGAICAAIGGMVGYIVGWLRGLVEAEERQETINQSQETPTQ